jgi:hypothetical protein
MDFSNPEFANFAQQFIPPPGGFPPGTPPPPGSFPPGTPPPPGSPGAPPPTFADFPFAQFLQDHPIQAIIPGAPPKFEPGAAFGQFTFGNVPPPPPGFPPFPPPPELVGFFPPPPPLGPGVPPPGTLPPGAPPPPGGFPPGVAPPGFPPTLGPLPPFAGVPIGPPPELPPGLPDQFYVFHDALAAMHDFLSAQPFPPLPPIPGDGADGLPAGGPFAFVDFESVAEFLPPSFLPPDLVAGAFEDFGAGHPLIGDGGEVNPDLEEALAEHPPIPPGFDGFDFTGDAQQFDDLFTLYNAANVGLPTQGQVNATFTGLLEDGSEARCSDTTLFEALTGQATPLILMEPGVYQTQWVVDIHQTTSSHVVIQHPDAQDGLEVDITTEVFSQMTWTMLIKEVDTDGDGVADEVHTSGANTIEVIEETVDGSLPEGIPALPPPPELLLQLQFQGVMGAPPAPAEPSQ